jgi:hypothetical protein
MRRYRGKGNWGCDREECEPGPFCFILLFYRSSPSSSYDAFPATAPPRSAIRSHPCPDTLKLSRGNEDKRAGVVDSARRQRLCEQRRIVLCGLRR